MLTLRSTSACLKKRVRYLATTTRYFPDEPSQPTIKTPIPGPRSKEIMSQLNQYQDTRSVFFIAGRQLYIKSYSVYNIFF